ncbi:MAG: 50S ribosomal protein L34e [Candidatus Caldarchaeum sp.]|nr:50S ribosomal protein L34e [Candidatus Caldarchaeum sp.]
MVRRGLRTRSRIRRKVRTPGGSVKLHFRGQTDNTRRCGICGRPVHGVSVRGGRGISSKRVSRPYSTVCNNCYRDTLITKVSAEWAS